jgi:hypothetical protein
MASWIDSCLGELGTMVDDNGGSLDLDMAPQMYNLTKDILARSNFGSNFEKGKEGFINQENHRKLLMEQGLLSNLLSR